MADHIDRAIDDTARALTAGEPDLALRARIIARLDDREPARRAWWIGAPIAAAALIAIALVSFSGRGRTSLVALNPAVAPAPGGTPAAPRTQTPASRVDASTTAVAGGETPAAPRTQPPAAPRTQTLVDASAPPERTTAAKNAAVEGALPPRGERVRTRRAAADASDTSPVTELAPPPLEVPSIAVAPIEGGPSLQLDRLAPITPVAVAPLDIEGTANRQLPKQNREPSSFSQQELR